MAKAKTKTNQNKPRKVGKTGKSRKTTTPRRLGKGVEIKAKVGDGLMRALLTPGNEKTASKVNKWAESQTAVEKKITTVNKQLKAESDTRDFWLSIANTEDFASKPARSQANIRKRIADAEVKMRRHEAVLKKHGESLKELEANLGEVFNNTQIVKSTSVVRYHNDGYVLSTHKPVRGSLRKTPKSGKQYTAEMRFEEIEVEGYESYTFRQRVYKVGFVTDGEKPYHVLIREQLNQSPDLEQTPNYARKLFEELDKDDKVLLSSIVRLNEAKSVAYSAAEWKRKKPRWAAGF